MSAISEFAARQNAHNDKIETAIAGVQADINALNELISEFQGTSGKINAEDQALLDQLEARGAAMAAKMEALDGLTAPVVPGDVTVPGAVTPGPVQDPNRAPNPPAPPPVVGPVTAPVTEPGLPMTTPAELPANPDPTSSQLRGSGGGATSGPNP